MMRAGGPVEAGRHRQFEIHDCLGRGGFGEVYRATMVSPGGLKTKVALKLLRSDVDPGGDAMLRLRDEGRLLAALRHPSILRAYDLALLDGRIGLVTEFVDGTDLHRLVGVLEPRGAVTVAEAVAEALDAAWSGVGHEGGEPLRLVHRDIKPSNIRISRHGEVKLLDFGIARSDEVDREARTGTGSTVGSLSYMAPERFSRHAPGPAADVYALGCTLYEVLVGRRLHQDPVPVEMFRLAANPDAHARHIEEAMRHLPPEAEEVRSLLVDMTQHTPEARPSAKEVARRAEDLVDALDGPALKRWAKSWDWPAPDRVEGSFDGRTITEGTLSRARILEPPPPTAGSDTFALDLDDTERMEVEAETEADVTPMVADGAPAAVESPRGMWVAGVGLVVLMAVAGLWFSSSSPEAPAPPKARTPVVMQGTALIWNAGNADLELQSDRSSWVGGGAIVPVDHTPIRVGGQDLEVAPGLLYRCAPDCAPTSWGLLTDPPAQPTRLELPPGHHEPTTCVLQVAVAPRGNVVRANASGCADGLADAAVRVASTWTFAARERPEEGALVVSFEGAEVPVAPDAQVPEPRPVPSASHPVVPEQPVVAPVTEPEAPPPVPDLPAVRMGTLVIEANGVDVWVQTPQGQTRGGPLPAGDYPIYVNGIDTRKRVGVQVGDTAYITCSPTKLECSQDR